jgi:hypothetical protein
MSLSCFATLVFVIVLHLVMGVVGEPQWFRHEVRNGYSVGFVQQRLDGFVCHQVQCNNKLLVEGYVPNAAAWNRMFFFIV